MAVSGKGNNMRVLLVEDDSATAQSIELMLKSESFNVYTTDLGEEGVDLGKLYDYDIILLDLNLPDMSGYEVLRSLRLAKIKTPILILSGMAGIEDKVRGLGFGADDYMTKPNWLPVSMLSCAAPKAMRSQLSIAVNCWSISMLKPLKLQASACI
jgi:two-component system, cell cycle response regulator CtrA